ncbi:hypothetical protein GN958_ATG10850 [Phytophthora infestans]|uniref:Uncharacterized protein n=1 Tax=Phytophthora infestans TaxID=4787 RepID=A0A8S9UHH4_PHYIN|nr:hypothetical protein GN958_ATG10850 [Phytophthora infestans]
MQQQTDTQLRDFGNRFKSTQAELPQRVETLVKLSLERRNDSLLDQLQQKLLEAQAQHLRDIESKNQNSLAAISAKLDKAAVETSGLHTKQELFEIASETQAPMSLETRQLEIPDAVVNSPKRGTRPLPDTQHGTQVLSGGMSQSQESVAQFQQANYAENNLSSPRWDGRAQQSLNQAALSRLNLLEARRAAQRGLKLRIRASADERSRADCKIVAESFVRVGSDDGRNIALKETPLMQRLADLFRERLTNVKTFVRRAAVRALEALLRAHAGNTAHASSKKDQFDIHARGTDSSFVVRAHSIKSLSAILLKFPRDEEAHNL